MARGGGGFTYLVNVIPRLAKACPEDRFRLYLRSERLAASFAQMSNVEVVNLPAINLFGRLRFTYVEMPRLAAAWHADLYFSAGEYAPLWAPCPTIAAFRNPNVFTPMNQGWPLKQRLRLRVLRTLAQASARACDRILFVSSDSARWIGDGMGLAQDRRAVIHHGIDLELWRPHRQEWVHPRPYILSVSSVYRYKNYVRLIEAWEQLARRRQRVPDLVMIGDYQDPEYLRRMHERRRECGELAERIHILGEVSYAEIRSWYANAALFVFPSYLETFGHPLLEAMASDVPLVAADIPVFREIAGDAAFFADPLEPEALARAMEEALFFEGARQALVKRGRERVRKFTWDQSARRLLQLFESVLAGRSLPAANPAPLRARPHHLGWQEPAVTGLVHSRVASDQPYRGAALSALD
jgi:glycosyltransferase involved in cell wall biosynthesis